VAVFDCLFQLFQTSYPQRNVLSQIRKTFKSLSHNDVCGAGRRREDVVGHVPLTTTWFFVSASSFDLPKTERYPREGWYVEAFALWPGEGWSFYSNRERSAADRRPPAGPG
jgi:hypothetical protein